MNPLNLLRNLASGLSGFYGDFLALFMACCCIFFIFARSLKVVQPLQPHPLLPSPLPFALSAVALWTSSPAHPPVFHQHLTMLPFVLACFIRFAGTWTDVPRSAHSLLARALSRASEYTMLYCALSQPSTCNAFYILPLVVLLATGRSNEILRAWKSDRRKTYTERHQFGEAIACFEKWVQAAAATLPISQSQQPLQPQQSLSQSQSQSQPPQPAQPQLQVLQTLQPRAAQYPQPRPQSQPHKYLQNPLSQPTHHSTPKQNNCAFQLGYFWIDGSGTLVTATTMVLVSSCMCLIHSSINFLSVSVSVIYILAIIYLWLECLPGLFVRLNNNLPKLMKNCPRMWLDKPFLWAQDWCSLLKDVANWTSSPFRCQELPKLFQLPFYYVETSELFIHVLIAVISRLTLHAFLLSFMGILKATRLTNLVPFNCKHRLQPPLVWFMTHYSKPELQLIRDHFLNNQKHYVLVSLSFEKMDTYSTVRIDETTDGTSDLPSIVSSEIVKILEGYCPVKANEEECPGYGRLKGTFVDLEDISTIQDRSNIQAVVGGWVITKDPQDENWIVVSRWGNAEPDPNGRDCCVARLYQGIHHTKIWEGNKPGDMEVYVKWGSIQDAIVITHMWQNNQLILGLFDWAPPLKDATVYADDVTSFPDQTTWRLTWKRKERFFLL